MIINRRPDPLTFLKNTKQLECSTLQQLEFILTNVGHWYGGPPAMDVITFINFAPEFELIRMKYGSNLERTYSKERLSPNGMKYFKAKGMKLSVGELGERIMVEIKTPDKCGNYDIRLSAMSANGVDCKKEFVIKCISIDVSSSSKD